MYLMDSNTFMEANRLYYAFDIAPGFWDWLGDSSLSGQVASVDAVKDEITAGSGDLVDWARRRLGFRTSATPSASSGPTPSACIGRSGCASSRHRLAISGPRT